MAKLLLKFTGQPANMFSEQLFDDQDHLNGWLKENEDKFTNVKQTKKELTFDGGSATIEEKPDNFKNS